MKEYRPNPNITGDKRFKPSKFFENFIQQKGPSGVKRASVAEIQKNLRQFYLDLVYGNVVQDKYIPFLIEDPRVVNEAIIDSENKLVEFTIILQSMDSAVRCMLPISNQPMFTTVYNKYMMRANIYGVILSGLKNFVMTGDTGFLVSICAHLNSKMVRGAKQQFDIWLNLP